MTKDHAPNWIKLTPGFITRLLGKCEYMVADTILTDGKYLLDRYFVRHEVHIEYPDKGDMRHPDFPNFVMYRIRFKKKDEGRVREALEEMDKQSGLMDKGYQKGLDHFREVLGAAAT